jgi:hypothetical protein
MIVRRGVEVAVPASGGSVGGGSVSVGVAAKIAVWVRFGVGKVNGVGEAAPGSVHPANSSSVLINRNFRILTRIAASE